MRFAWIAVSLAVGCGTRSEPNVEGGDSATSADADTDALVCAALASYAPTNDPPFYACPTIFGSFDCARVKYLGPLTCPSGLEGFRVGLGIDTAGYCFYDHASHALVGVLQAGNWGDTCYGVVDTACSQSPVNLCSGG